MQITATDMTRTLKETADAAVRAAVAAERDRCSRLRATLLNIQAMAERGNPIDNAKLAEQCRRSLNSELG